MVRRRKVYKMKNGFTLAETLITLTVIGIVASVTIPMLSSSRPNRERVMLKKAYATISRVIAELAQDKDKYPKFSDTGFYSYENRNDATYFRNNIKEKLNTMETRTITQDQEFYTTDGIYWFIPDTNWGLNPTVTIWVDVNGEQRLNGAGYRMTKNGPDCFESESCPLPDRFEIEIDSEGDIKVIGNKAKEYLSSTKFND